MTANETPKSSAPSTPNDDSVRSVPAQINSDDYFGRAPRLPNASTRSLPTTPHGSMRNISFSPRIQFHDAWSASDYDRRGDIATCNRLTPMLAQQIKEELNTFKMVSLSPPLFLATLLTMRYRRWKSMSCQNLTPISSNDYASSPGPLRRLGEYTSELLLGLEQIAFTSCPLAVSFSGYEELVSSVFQELKQPSGYIFHLSEHISK